MKLLIDECAPRDLKLKLVKHGYECSTVQELGYSGKKNGELLSLAEGKHDVFITLDKNLQYQQKLTGRKIAILLIGAKSNDIDDILPHLPACLLALQSIRPGQIIRVGWMRKMEKWKPDIPWSDRNFQITSLVQLCGSVLKFF